MKKKFDLMTIIIIVLGLVVVAGIIFAIVNLKNKNIQDVKESDGISKIRNLKFPYFDKEIQLEDGQYKNQDETIDAGLLEDKVAYGDIDGDKKDDIATVLYINNGGGKELKYVALVLDKNSDSPKVFSAFIGDRAQINEIKIEGDKIIIKAKMHLQEDLLVNPTNEKEIIFEFKDGQLLEVVK